MTDETVKPAAWMHPDGRVVPAATKDAADRDGGAMRSSLVGYTIPLYGPDALAAERERWSREPVAAQCRFPGVAWTQCDVEHARMVLAKPSEWPRYEVRLLCELAGPN
jgi:hypothetical protein